MMALELKVFFLLIACLNSICRSDDESDDEFVVRAVWQVELTVLSKPTTSPIVQGKKPPDGRILDLYCYENVEELNFLSRWTSVCFDLLHEEFEVEILLGHNETEIYEAFKTRGSNWRTFFTYSSRHICFSPFERACIGICTVHSYKLNLVVQEFDSWLVGCSLCGVLLFFFAGQLSRCKAFQYVGGMTVSPLTVVILTCFLSVRLFTQKFAVVLGSMATGSALTLGFLKWLWVNRERAVEFYKEYLVCYAICSALLSFAFCYYFGPITNECLLDLLKWFVHGVALLMFCVGIQAPGVCFIVISLLFIDVLATFCWHHIRQ